MASSQSQRGSGYGPARPGRVPVWVRPPAAARELARRALARREKLPASKRGGLSKSEAGRLGITSGVVRAESISRGDYQPAQDVRDFFSRFRGIHAGALAKGKSWEDSKVQQAWDLWGGEDMWLAAREALDAAGEKPGPEPNPEQFWTVGPQQPLDTDTPWRDETLAWIEKASADPQLRMLMGARLHWLAGRLRLAPSRDKKFERVRFDQIRPVEYEGAPEGWYHDALSGQKVVFEDAFDPPYWVREVPYPRGAFTVGELAALEGELWRAAERVADARGTLSQDQRQLAVDTIVEAAEGLELRLALMQWQPESPEEAAAFKRSLLEILARGDEPEENPAGVAGTGCTVLAAHEYRSPRQRSFTAKARRVRQIAYELKQARRHAAKAAAVEMAQLVGPADVLVPVPDSLGSTKANRRLCKYIARLSGSAVCDTLTRRLQVPSSRALRAAGVAPLTVQAHQMLRMHGCPAGRTVLVDNVVTSGGTALAAAEALGVECVVLAWAWHRSWRELEASNPSEHDPELVVTGPKTAARAMQHPAVKKQAARALRRRKKHDVAVLIPCAEEKPYRESRSHRLGYLPALEGKKVDVWVVSEPMGVVPYEWTDEYPNDAYEFAPKHVKGEVREQLVARIRAWLEKQGPKYRRIFLALPGHHMALVCDAAEGLTGLHFYDASISACRELGHCPPTHFRATSSAYVDYLRRSIR